MLSFSTSAEALWYPCGVPLLREYWHEVGCQRRSTVNASSVRHLVRPIQGLIAERLCARPAWSYPRPSLLLERIVELREL